MGASFWLCLDWFRRNSRLDKASRKSRWDSTEPPRPRKNPDVSRVCVRVCVLAAAMGPRTEHQHVLLR